MRERLRQENMSVDTYSHVREKMLKNKNKTNQVQTERKKSHERR